MLSAILLKGKVVKVCVIVFCVILYKHLQQKIPLEDQSNFLVYRSNPIILCGASKWAYWGFLSLIWNLNLENNNQTFKSTFLSRLVQQWGSQSTDLCVCSSLQISMNAGATQAASVLTSVRILLVPTTALVPWASNFQLMVDPVKVRLSVLWLWSVRNSSLLFQLFFFILAWKTALEWQEKSSQCSLFE